MEVLNNMCECNYVYAVININSGIPIKNKLFSTWAKADAYRKELSDLYPNNSGYYTVEALEVK